MRISQSDEANLSRPKLTFTVDEYVAPKILPWQTILQDIINTGISPYYISELINLEWSTTQRYFNGTEPKESIGTAILILHTRRCGIELTEVRKQEAIYR